MVVINSSSVVFLSAVTHRFSPQFLSFSPETLSFPFFSSNYLSRFLVFSLSPAVILLSNPQLLSYFLALPIAFRVLFFSSAILPISQTHCFLPCLSLFFSRRQAHSPLLILSNSVAPFFISRHQPLSSFLSLPFALAISPATVSSFVAVFVSSPPPLSLGFSLEALSLA